MTSIVRLARSLYRTWYRRFLDGGVHGQESSQFRLALGVNRCPLIAALRDIVFGRRSQRFDLSTRIAVTHRCVFRGDGTLRGASIWFGKRVLGAEVHYRGLGFLAWMSIMSGICLASVVFFVVAITFGVVANIALALLFFEAAREVKALTLTT